MRHSTKTFAALLIIIFTVVMWPHAAHAGSLLDIFSDPVATIANLIIGLLQWIQIALGKFVLWLVSILTTLILQPGLNTGGAAVFAVWKVFRDLCNSFFLVFFILIAFSTIFHSVWKGGAGYYYRNALLNVIVAAILVNFSLPIGQTIVWAGNQATLAVMGLMRGTNIEARIVAALSVDARAANVPPVKSTYAVPDLTKPTDQLVKGQDIITANFDAEVQAFYEKCNAESQKSQKDGGCLGAAMKMRADQNKQTLDAAAKAAASGSRKGELSFLRKAYNGTIAIIGGLITGGGSPAGVAVNTALIHSVLTINSIKDMRETDPAILAGQMGIAFGNILLLLLMTISFLCVIAFMVIRLPMIWFLLAGSAVACFFYAVPKSTRAQNWFGDMIGYNIFGPAYLFVIYIGLLVLTLQSTLLVGLKNAQWYEGLLGAFLFTGIATAIFTGGAAAAWKFAFSFSTDLKERVTKYGEAVGVSEKSMFGLKSGSAAISRTTGATAVYEGAKANVARRYKEAVTDKGQRYRDTAKAWAEGGKAKETLRRSRISEQMKKNKDLGLSNTDLKTELKNVGSDEYYAAAKELLDRDELSPSEMQTYVQAAYKVSPSYGRSAQEEVNKKLRGRSKEKKFTGKEITLPDGSKTSDTLEAFRAMTDSGDRQKFLRDLKKNQVLEYAKLAAQAEVEKDVMAVEGSSVAVLAQDILSNNLSKIDAESIGKAMEEAKKNGWPIDAELQLRFDDLAAEKGNHYKLLDGAKDSTARNDIRDRLKQLKADADKAVLDREITVAKAGAQELAAASADVARRVEAEDEDRLRDLARARGVPYVPPKPTP